MKQNKWCNYNQCNPTRSNQKSEARQAIDDAARAKKEAIDQTPDATTEEKEAAKAKVDQAVTEAKAHINEAINNSGVDEAKQMVRIQSMQSNQKLRKNKSKRGN